MQHKILKLKSGLELILAHATAQPTVSVQIWFRAGSALESAEDQGIAHFLEHMFFKGTAKRPEGKMTYEVESFGGEINAFTSFDYTCYYINAPKANLMECIDILLDMVSAPLFKDADLSPEREVVFEEYRRSLDAPKQFGFMKVQEACFPKSYAHPIIGNEGTIKKFSLDQLKKFRENFYNNQNAFLLVAGDVESIEDEIIQLATKFQLPDGHQSAFTHFELKGTDTINHHQKDVRMANLTWSISSLGHQDIGSEHEDLGLSILGHGDSSRLYTSLVSETGIANNCSTSTMFFKKGGVHILSFNFPLTAGAKVIDALTQELEQTLNDGPTEEEIIKIKNQYLASKVYDLENIENFAFSLGHSYALTGDILGEEKYLQRIKTANRHQVDHALHSLLARPWHFTLQIPKDTSASPLEKKLQQLIKVKKHTLLKVGTKRSLPRTISKHDALASTIQLQPGITLFYRQNKTAPTFILHTYLKGGLADESVKNNGLYNLLSSQLTNGHKYISYDELRKFMDDHAASLSGFSGKNAYGLTLHGQSDHFYALADHFFNSLINPTFPGKYFKLEKGLHLRAILNEKEDTVRQCFNSVAKIMFAGHPYALSPLGTKESVTSLTETAVKRTHYANLKNKEMLITYCGDKNLEEILPFIQNFVSALPPRKIVKPKPFHFKHRAQSKGIDFPREQAQIYIGLPIGDFTHPDHIYIKMLSTFLSGQSSELFMDVRDKKGLCYSVAPIHFSALNGGHFGIYMGSGKDKVQDAIKAIVDLFKKYKTSHMSRADFERIKKMIKGQNILNLQTNEDYATTYSVPILHNKGIDFIHEVQTKIDQTTYENFSTNVSKILSRPLSIVLVGPGATEIVSELRDF
ncbi:MAG: hypothetical protein A2X86_04220 [Bdellovibrionales bacterium GWA2_49_15]|nr:MAG: hypothetical protein A2X86_04220 [Bdellovibrionales bacterium GWA2_49_15]HAZ12788.1 hypothetical protein [Bdellovibrionales bacterium]